MPAGISEVATHRCVNCQSSYDSNIKYHCVNVSLDKPLEILSLLDSPCLNFDLKTLLFTFGYTGKVDTGTTKLVLDTYMGEGDYNVILLDWQKEASDHGLVLGLGYTLDALEIVPKIGKRLGDAITILINGDINLDTFHLMGLSLGAQLVGYAARRTKENNITLPWVTGLDPAGPSYEGPVKLLRIDKNCGDYVEIVHTDQGRAGTVDATGHVDYWPNYGIVEKTGAQPGYPTGITHLADACSHHISWQYYMEAVRRPKAFPGSWAKNYKSWAAVDDRCNDVIYMAQIPSPGYKKGNYYLTTNHAHPYGRDKDGLKPDDSECQDNVAALVPKLTSALIGS